MQQFLEFTYTFTGNDSDGFGDGSNSERLRILSGGGITFNGDSASANALNDYEEGTYTPTITLVGVSPQIMMTPCLM